MYADEGYHENWAFAVIDKIQEKGILSMIDDNGELNHEGIMSLKDIFEQGNNLQDNSKVTLQDCPEDQLNMEAAKREDQEVTCNKNQNNSQCEKERYRENINLRSGQPTLRQNVNNTIDVLSDKSINKQVKKRIWCLLILYCLCVLIYIIIPLTTENEDTKLGEFPFQVKEQDKDQSSFTSKNI